MLQTNESSPRGQINLFSPCSQNDHPMQSTRAQHAHTKAWQRGKSSHAKFYFRAEWCREMRNCSLRQSGRLPSEARGSLIRVINFFPF